MYTRACMCIKVMMVSPRIFFTYTGLSGALSLLAICKLLNVHTHFVAAFASGKRLGKPVLLPLLLPESPYVNGFC